MAKEMTLQSVLDGRIETYEMLARLFRSEVDDDMLAEMKKMRCPLNTGNDDVDEGYRLFHSYLSHLWERSGEDLARDFTDVFIGANTTGHAAAYPNESVHTSPDRLVMQDARDEVLAIYNAAGLVGDEKWKSGEDHIATELEYMFIMAGRAAKAVSEKDMEHATALLLSQYHFIIDHLLNWVPFLVADMLKFATTDFYRALAHLTIGFLNEDKAFLEELLAEDLHAERVAADEDAQDASDAELPLVSGE